VELIVTLVFIAMLALVGGIIEESARAKSR